MLNPKINVDYKTVGVGALAIVGLYLFFKSEAKAGAEAVGKAINPLSVDNAAYKAANATVAALGGGSNPLTGKPQTLGGWLYYKFNPKTDTEQLTPSQRYYVNATKGK